MALLLTLAALASRFSTLQAPGSSRPAESASLFVEEKAESPTDMPPFGGVNIGQGFGMFGNAVEHLLGKPTAEEMRTEKRKEEKRRAEAKERKEEERAML